MTTKLSQKRVKGGDVSYPTLYDEMRARTLGTGTGGGGYVVPTGGIPKSDLSTHLQDLLTNVENSLLIHSIGVELSDLSPELEDAILRIDEKYTKPTDGIKLQDLEQTLQDRLLDFSNFYVYPSNGIPRVDLDDNVKRLLALAETAYQKPDSGIRVADVSKEILDMILTGISRYELPTGGIPDSDLAEQYAKASELTPVKQHIDNMDIHITDHDKLLNIGAYTHPIIDEMLDSHDLSINSLVREIDKAREEFGSIGDRLNSLLGLNSVFSVSTEDEWKQGLMTDLKVNKEGFVGLTYQPDRPLINLYDISVDDFFKPENHIGTLYFESDSRINLGTRPWQYITNRRTQVGLKLDVNIYADVSGIYEFATQFSGRMRLQVGSKLLYDTSSVVGQVDAYTRTGQVELEAGRLYRLVFEGWYQFEGDRLIGLTWKRPGTNSHVEILPEYFNTTGHMTRSGQYVSEIIDMRDTNISKWVFELDASENRYEDDIIVELQRSVDNVTWSTWQEIKDVGEINLTPTRFCRVRITVHQRMDFYTPVLHGYKIRFISSMNNEIMNEISIARDHYLSIGERLRVIEDKIQKVVEFDELQDQNSIHPEYFASVRLAEQDTNMLKMMLLEANRLSKAINFGQAIADSFFDNKLIDDEKSAPYEIVGNAVRTLDSNLRLETSQEWAKWDLKNLDYVADLLRLSYSIKNSITDTVSFSNWYLWSTRDTARLAGNYQAYIAQPFYTSANMNLITRLQLQTYDASAAPQATIMICPTQKNADLPDLQNPVWSNFIGYTTGVINKTGLRVPVFESTKYWIVIKRETIQSTSGYSRWYLSANNTSTHARLRGTNPKSEYLYVRYTADANGKTAWLTDTSYFLTFYIDEGNAFESAGEGSRIIDYQRENSYHSIVPVVTTPTGSLVTFTYQSSSDAQNWSPSETDPSLLPKERFLKINVSMQKGTSNQTPTLSRIDIYSKHNYSELITMPIEVETIPTHAVMVAVKDESIHFEVSRDDGHTWLPITDSIYTQLGSIQPGTMVRLKAIFHGDYPNHWLHEWAWLVTTYKDITQQNVTALYEEYIAEERQQVFKLKDTYVMGNYSLQVYLNGIRQSLNKDYIEVDNQTVMFNEQLLGGLDADRVTFVVAAGAYDQHDAFLKSEIDFVKERVDHLNVSHSKTHEYNEKDQLVSTVFNHESYIQRIDYEYDDKGRKSKETKTTKTYVEVIVYTYNDRGFLLGEAITVNEVTN